MTAACYSVTTPWDPEGTRRRLRQAYVDGHRAGRLDRVIGCANDYSLHGSLDPRESYSSHYSLGYRDGLIGKAR
jgi:hypothetical protein